MRLWPALVGCIEVSVLRAVSLEVFNPHLESPRQPSDGGSSFNFAAGFVPVSSQGQRGGVSSQSSRSPVRTKPLLDGFGRGEGGTACRRIGSKNPR